MDWLIPDATPDQQLAMLSVIVSGVVALIAVLASLLVPRLSGRWEHRRWLRDRRTECYDELMQIMEDGNLFYQYHDAPGPSEEEEIASQLKALKSRVRLYGSTKTIRLLDDLVESFNLSTSDRIEAVGYDDEIDLHVKKAWLASMKLLNQLQRETRRPMPRVMRRPIYARELKKTIKDLERLIRKYEREEAQRHREREERQEEHTDQPG